MMQTVWVKSVTGIWHATLVMPLFGRSWNGGQTLCGRGIDFRASRLADAPSDRKCRVCSKKVGMAF